MDASDWAAWVAAAASVVAAVTGVMLLWRGRVRLCLEPRVQMGQQGRYELFVDLVNPGRVAVSVEKVVLAGVRDHLPAFSNVLQDSGGHPGFPVEVLPGKKRAIGPVHDWTLKGVLVFKPVAVVAHTEDGRRVQARCPGLRQIYAQMELAAGANEAAQP